MTSGARNQYTLQKPAELTGFGFFTGADATVKFLPAPEHHGIVFKRTDLTGQPTVAATIANVLPAQRRTTIRNGAAEVQLIEHVMAALAGLQIDNVLIEINAPELPGCDGSCREFCETLLDAGITEQNELANAVVICENRVSVDRHSGSEITVRPHIRPLQAITYQLDYGHRSPVVAQRFSIELTPEAFLREIAWARTFVLESEVRQLRQAGFGQRVTEKDLLVFGPDGVIGNTLRSPDECARHKILDCIGDFALFGGEIFAHFDAWRSGHSQNHQLIREIKEHACPSGTLLRAA